MAQSRELPRVSPGDESPETATGDILEEHPLDGVEGAKAEDLIPLRLDHASGHAQEL